MKMGRLIILFICCFLVLNIDLCAQDDENVQGNGLSFEAGFARDFVNNFSGGIKTGNTYLGVIDLGITLNTEEAGLWPGGELYVQIENTHGGKPTEGFVGDMQVLSNIENAENSLTYMYELWINQSIGNLSVKAGLLDLNAEFNVSEYAGTFINSTFGIQSSMPVNIPVPIFPLNALGAMLKYDHSDALAVQLAFYDGDPGDYFDENDELTDPHHLNWTLSSDEGFLGIGEIHFSTISGEETTGTYKLGGYYHSGVFDDFSDTAKTVDGNYGLYLVGDHNISDNLGAFFQLGWAPTNINVNDVYVGFGINYTGLIPGRDDDVFGLAVAYAGLSKDFRMDLPDLKGHETAIEFTYAAQINDNVAIQPDIQYIINPSGTGEALDNALVGLVRLSIGF